MTPRTAIETHTGLLFDYARPAAADVRVEDIARGLAFTCRFGGHTERFYSVAEHALCVAHLVREAGHPELELAALHHDSHEAYVGDLPTPLKALIGEAYYVIRGDIDAAIAEAFDIDPEQFHHPAIVEADRLALRAEAGVLKRSRGTLLREALGASDVPELPEGPWCSYVGPLRAEALFLAAHAKLTGGDPVAEHRPSSVESEREAILASTGAAGNHALVRCDGGGQAPGPVSWAAIVDMDGGSSVRVKHAERGTNNTAEYMGLLAGLDLAYELGATHVTAYSDSQLIVNHVNGAWKARDATLKALLRKAHEAMRRFEHVTVQWVPRESNREADALASAALGEARA